MYSTSRLPMLTVRLPRQRGARIIEVQDYRGGLLATASSNLKINRPSGALFGTLVQESGSYMLKDANGYRFLSFVQTAFSSWHVVSVMDNTDGTTVEEVGPVARITLEVANDAYEVSCESNEDIVLVVACFLSIMVFRVWRGTASHHLPIRDREQRAR